VEVVVGRAVRGLELAKDAARRGTSVIVTRGITAERIRSAMDIPVIEISVTGFDMLRAYLQAKQLGTPVGVADEKRIIAYFSVCCDYSTGSCAKMVSSGRDPGETGK